jgi:Flp pilus assembly protein TadD
MNCAAAALLVLAVIAAYANSFLGPFLFDDVNSIVENPSIRQLWSWRVLSPPPDAITMASRPVVNLSLAINYALGGLNVWDYHAANLAIHIVAALALLGIVRRTLLLPALAGRLGGASTGLALAVALLWALHPLQTESVTYIVQRAESLVGLFYLLTLYCVLRGVASSRRAFWYVAATAACALGMASKEVMVSAPLVVLLFDRIFVSGSFAKALRIRRRLYLGLSATWAILAWLVYIARVVPAEGVFNVGMTSWQYARTQFYYIIHYLRLALWPSPLVLDYGVTVATSATQIVPYAIVVVLLLAVTAMALVRRPKLGFLGIWFFAILAPTSSFVPLAGQVAAERRMYLPLAAVIALTVLAAYAGLAQGRRRLARQADSAPGRTPAWLRATAWTTVLAAATALGAATWQRNQSYRSALSILADTVEKCPSNFRARAAYAGELVESDPDAALWEADLAVGQKPDYAVAYDARGCARQAKGLPEAAIRDFDQAVALKPRYAKAYSDRAVAHGSMEQYDAAVKDCDKAIELKPSFAGAYNNRAVAHYRLKDYRSSWADVRTCMDLGGVPAPEFLEALRKSSGTPD